MTEYTLTVVDTTGIQSYIFGSNKLRENIGASYLVKQVTENWIEDTLYSLAQKHNIKIHIPDEEHSEAKPWIEDGDLAAEQIYSGGGNAVLLFQSKKYAIEFTKILSKRVLLEAPGINFVVAHREFDWDREKLYDVVEKTIQNDLEQQKQKRITSSPLLGLGVTAACKSTGLVAVDNSKNYNTPGDNYLISREIKAKLNAVNLANKDLSKQILDDCYPTTCKLPLDFDDFGRTEGEMSYLAVVHIDGNNMGKRFKKHGEGKENRNYITEMRKLSNDVKRVSKQALIKITNLLIASVVEDKDRKVKTIKNEFDLKDNFLPFRPLVYGGDDVTFVCDGRLGLELAAVYLKELEQKELIDGKKLYACAGICIVKAHYPFTRSYKISEELCGKAKKFVKDKAPDNFSAIDWHIASSGLIGSISDIRQREYTVSSGSLNMRPLRITKSNSEWRTWRNFTQVVKNFKKYWSVNKVIALREILRDEKEELKRFLTSYSLPDLPHFSDSRGSGKTLAKRGWKDRICGYFDPIEAMDFYISLEEDKDETVSTEN